VAVQREHDAQMARVVAMNATTDRDGDSRVVRASRVIAASASRVFELIADPAEQPRWDGNDNLSEAAAGQRVRAVGDVFVMTLTGGEIRENHVVEFDEGRRTQLTDENRFSTARATTSEMLHGSLDRLASLAEGA
jgi:uncharacterized protein YndB with AHSA1/START domain